MSVFIIMQSKTDSNAQKQDALTKTGSMKPSKKTVEYFREKFFSSHGMRTRSHEGQQAPPPGFPGAAPSTDTSSSEKYDVKITWTPPTDTQKNNLTMVSIYKPNGRGMVYSNNYNNNGIVDDGSGFGYDSTTNVGNFTTTVQMAADDGYELSIQGLGFDDPAWTSATVPSVRLEHSNGELIIDSISAGTGNPSFPSLSVNFIVSAPKPVVNDVPASAPDSTPVATSEIASTPASNKAVETLTQQLNQLTEENKNLKAMLSEKDSKKPADSTPLVGKGNDLGSGTENVRPVYGWWNEDDSPPAPNHPLRINLDDGKGILSEFEEDAAISIPIAPTDGNGNPIPPNQSDQEVVRWSSNIHYYPPARGNMRSYINDPLRYYYTTELRQNTLNDTHGEWSSLIVLNSHKLMWGGTYGAKSDGSFGVVERGDVATCNIFNRKNRKGYIPDTRAMTFAVHLPGTGKSQKDKIKYPIIKIFPVTSLKDGKKIQNLNYKIRAKLFSRKQFKAWNASGGSFVNNHIFRYNDFIVDRERWRLQGPDEFGNYADKDKLQQAKERLKDLLDAESEGDDDHWEFNSSGVPGPVGIPPGFPGPDGIPPGFPGPDGSPPGVPGPPPPPPGQTIIDLNDPLERKKVNVLHSGRELTYDDGIGRFPEYTAGPQLFENLFDREYAVGGIVQFIVESKDRDIGIQGLDVEITNKLHENEGLEKSDYSENAATVYKMPGDARFKKYVNVLGMAFKSVGGAAIRTDPKDPLNDIYYTVNSEKEKDKAMQIESGLPMRNWDTP